MYSIWKVLFMYSFKAWIIRQQDYLSEWNSSFDLFSYYYYIGCIARAYLSLHFGAFSYESYFSLISLDWIHSTDLLKTINSHCCTLCTILYKYYIWPSLVAYYWVPYKFINLNNGARSLHILPLLTAAIIISY